MGTSADIELLFGVLGGGSPSGASGKKIQNQLNNIIGHLNKNLPGLKIELNKNSIETLKQSLSDGLKTVKIESFNVDSAINKLKSDIQNTLNTLTIPSISTLTVGATTGTTSSSGSATTSSVQNTTSSQNINASTESVKTLTTALEGLSEQLTEVPAKADAATKSIKQVADAAASAEAAVRKLADANAGSDNGGSGKQGSTNATLQQIATLTRKAEALLKNNPRIVSKGYGDALNSVLNTLRSGDDISSAEFDKLKQSVLGVELGLKKAGLQGKTFWSVLKSGYEKFGGWALITRSLTAAINSVRKMITNVVELDAAMVELRKVTDETESTYENFFSEATVRARNLGATVTDTINATADFSRLGYSLEDAATLADTAIMYKNVGDGITDISVASESIISTLKGFGLEADSAMHVVDAFNEVGNNFAISSAGIGEALTRSAASLSAANNTLEESIALVTAMNTTLQDPEKVGTTIKTITMYLRAAKVELEEAGEDTDGLANSTSELRESVLALTGQKVDIMLNEDTFKSTYQIIKEISEVWSSISDIDQAALLELLGGKRNSNAVAALIQNFDIAESALESATDSAGSAANENEKYLDSILGKVAQFEAAFETLSATFIDSDLVKFVVDSGTTILDIITGLIDALGSLNTVAILASAALSFGNVNSLLSPVKITANSSGNGTNGFGLGFNFGMDFLNIKADKSGIDAYNKALDTYIKSIERIDKTLIGETSDEGVAATNAFTAATREFQDATDEAANSTSASTAEQIRSSAAQGENAKVVDGSTKSILKFKAATIGAKIASAALNAAISFGLSIAIQGIIEGLDYLIHREERIAEAAAEAESAIADIQESMSQTTETTEKAKTVIKAFGSEVKLVNGKLSSTTLSSEQLEQYAEAVKNLTDLYPGLISGHDAEGNALISLSAGYDALEDSINNAYKAALAYNALEIDEKMPDAVNGVSTEVKTLVDDYDTLQSQLSNLDNIDVESDIANVLNSVASWDEYEFTEQINSGSVGAYSNKYGNIDFGGEMLPEWAVEALNNSSRKYTFFTASGYRAPNFSDSMAQWTIQHQDIKGMTTTPGKNPTSDMVQEYMQLVFSEYSSDLQNDLSSLEAQIASKWQSVNSNLLSYLSADQIFSETDSQLGGALSQIVSNANWSELIGDNVTWEDIKSYAEQLSIALRNVSISSQGDIKTLLSSNATQLTAEEYTSLYNDIQTAILNATGDKDLTSTIMKSFESGAAYSQSDVDDIVNSFEDAWNERKDTILAMKNNEGEVLDSTDELNATYNEFYDQLESGNPTIAEMAAFLELVNDDTLKTAGSFSEFIDVYDDLVDSLSGTRTYNELVESLGAVKDAEDAAYNSYIRYGEAITRSEYDSMEKDDPYNTRVEHYKRMKELLEEGRVGSNEFLGYMKEFELNSVSEVEDFIAQRDSWYADGSDGLKNWIRYIYQLNQSGALSADIASVDFSSGEANFQFNINRLDEFAKALGMTKAELWEFIRATQVYSENWESMSSDELGEFLQDGGYIDENGFMNYEGMISLGYSKTEIDELLEKLNEGKEAADQIRLSKGLFGDLEDAGNDVEDLKRVFSEYTTLDLKIDNNQLVLTQDAINEMVNKFTDPTNMYKLLSGWQEAGVITFDADVKIDGKDPEVYFNDENDVATLTLNISDATATEIEGIRQQLEELGLLNIKINIDDSQLIQAYGKVSDIMEALNKLGGIGFNVSFYGGYMPSSGTSGLSSFMDRLAGQSGWGYRGNATGTNDAAPGYSLLGDEYSPNGSPRPELVVSGNNAYLAGVDGPTIGYLNKGDRVYTYSQTKKILRGNKHQHFPAFAGGLLDGFTIGGGSLWSSVSSSNGSLNIGSDFESQYKYHQHLLKMEQESQKDYLEWLDKAYKDAFAKGEIDLDEYYKYSEEVFELIREIAQDNLNDAEHYIEMLGHYDGSDKQIIAIYRELMSAIESEIASARASGLDDNDEYIQSLQKQWWSYYDEIEDIQDDIGDTVKDSLEDLIELRVKMIKQDLKNEKEALKDKKSYLKDYYDEQKELLQDAYDEEEYLEEQAEKRKAVYDLQMQLNQLEYDDSAWAQKKKLELMQELKDAQKELNDFEKDHALEKAQELLDDTYEAQEKEIEDEIELIEEKEDHAKNLREQAIADLQAADRQMYEDMIEWNAQYGSGIDQDITDAWESATKAMSNYYKLNQEYYEGIDITKGVYPDFLSDGGSWSSNPISGDNPANQSQQSSDSSNTSTGLEGSVSGISGSLRYGSRGSDVSALQTALKNMGLYSDSVDGKFGPNTRAAVMAFQRNKGISVDGIVGPNTKQKFKEAGYASGTANATAGIHEVWEEGSEYIFTSANGKRYKLLSGGDKVLNADATNFLYNFATGGSKILESIVNNLAGYNKVPTVISPATTPVVKMGDIIINGSATEQTVSQIRRAQREQVHTLLKEFGRLKQ